MKKHFITLVVFILFIVNMNGADPVSNIKEIKFKGINLSQTDYKIENGEESFHYSVAYSPFLPAGGIYQIKDNVTGKEAIIQIGIAQVDKSPYILYLPDHLFQFFASSYEKEIESLNLKLKFLGWNKEGEESLYLDILSLIIQPENSISTINQNGLDKYYIQIGAFSYYQNSYPQIIKSIPYLKVIPHFYLVPIKKSNGETIYKILAGPYNLNTAREVVQDINKAIKNKMYIHSGETIIKEQNQ